MGTSADLDIDSVCGLIESGQSLTKIALAYGLGRTTLTDWVARDPDRSARVREARVASGEASADMAEQVLEAADTPFELAKARELASHYRWRASKTTPATYGDRVQVDTQRGPLTVEEATEAELMAVIRGDDV